MLNFQILHYLYLYIYIFCNEYCILFLWVQVTALKLFIKMQNKGLENARARQQKHKIFFNKSLLWKFEKKTISASKMVDLLGVLVQERALLRWWCELEHLLNHINGKLISSIHRHNCSKQINISSKYLNFTSKPVFYKAILQRNFLSFTPS